jgi:hypothetical protein
MGGWIVVLAYLEQEPSPLEGQAKRLSPFLEIWKVMFLDTDTLW